MPFISIEIGQLTKSQKSALVKQITQSASEITNIPEEFFIVSIKELPDENIGIGGRTIDVIKGEHAGADT